MIVRPLTAWKGVDERHAAMPAAHGEGGYKAEDDKKEDTLTREQKRTPFVFSAALVRAHLVQDAWRWACSTRVVTMPGVGPCGSTPVSDGVTVL